MFYRYLTSLFFLQSIVYCSDFLTPCVQSGISYRNYTHLQNSDDWGGYLFGYCKGLFGPDDLIMPLASIGCRGEAGNMTLIRRSAGTLQPKCRKAMSKFMCTLFLPKSRSGLPALPCTNEQANVSNSSPQLLWEWISNSCPESIKNLELGGLKAAFDGIDNTHANQTGSITRPICRVVDDGDLDKPEDHFPDWKPELWECAEGMVKVNVEDQNDESKIGCAFPCPGPFFSDEQWDSLKKLLRVPNFLSTLFALLCAFLLYRLPEKRKFPANLVIILCLYAALIEFSLAISFFSEWGGNEFSSIWCKNSYTTENRLLSWCALQGALVMISGKGAVICWFLIVLNLYFVIGLGKRDNKKYENYYYIVAIVYPIVPVIFSIGLQKFGYPSSATNCLLSTEGRGLYEYILFFGDLLSIIFVGLILTFLLIIQLKRTKMTLASGRARSALFSIKIFLMLVYIFITFLLLVYVRLEASANLDVITESVTDYVTCLVVQFITAPEIFGQSPNTTYTAVSPDYSTCRITHPPNYTATIILQCFQCSVGMYLCMLFGFSGVKSENKIMLWLYDQPIVGSHFAAVMGYNTKVSIVSTTKASNRPSSMSIGYNKFVKSVFGDSNTKPKARNDSTNMATVEL